MSRCFSFSVGVRTAITEVKFVWGSKCWKCFSITYVDLTMSISVYYFMSYWLYYRLNPRSAGHFPSADHISQQWTSKICNKSWLLLMGLFPTTSQLFSPEAFSAWNKHLAAGRVRVPMTWQGALNVRFGPLFLF